MKRLVAVGVVLASLGLAGCGDAGSSRPQGSSSGPSAQSPNDSGQSSTTNPPHASSVRWELTGNGVWSALGSAPACPEQPMLIAPTDVAKVTGVLWPGQTRGEYKPHGGFRFDSSKNADVTVRAPMAARVYRGSRFLVQGELQYGFDFISPCGILYRFGHLLKLSPKMQAVADTFPPAVENDSRTTRVEATVEVSAGDVLATAVGVSAGGVNTFFDMGVYDLRKGNNKSSDAAYVGRYGMELAGHAVCWLDWLPGADATALKALPPGDPTSGRNSDYCTPEGKQIG